MGTFASFVAILSPLIGSVAIASFRPKGLMPGRFMSVACGIGSLAALVLLVWAAASDGVVGGSSVFGLDRVSALLLAAVSSLAFVVASFARRNVDVDPHAPRFFILFGLLVSGSALVVVPANAWFLLAGWIASSWALVALVGHTVVHRSTRRAQRRTAQALVVGDVALVARDDVTFHEEADSGPYQLICRHGSLTSAEVNVPLLAATA